MWKVQAREAGVEINLQKEKKGNCEICVDLEKITLSEVNQTWEAERQLSHAVSPSSKSSELST